MIDASRHFVPVENLELVLDGMSYEKLNVFHWHLTDAEVLYYSSSFLSFLIEIGICY
jgi:hexosaminidase